MIYKVISSIILSVILVVYFISSFIEPAPDKELTIATGSVNGTYYKSALKYKELLAKQHVKLNIINTTGSVENLDLVNAKKADIAFVQGGIIDGKDNPYISSLASVYYEPLWVFYKNRGYSIEYIVELISKKFLLG